MNILPFCSGVRVKVMPHCMLFNRIVLAGQVLAMSGLEGICFWAVRVSAKEVK